MSSNLNIPSSHIDSAPTPANSFVQSGLTAPQPSSTKPTVEDVDEEAEDDAAGFNPASLLAQVRSISVGSEVDLSSLWEVLLRLGGQGRGVVGWKFCSGRVGRKIFSTCGSIFATLTFTPLDFIGRTLLS